MALSHAILDLSCGIFICHRGRYEDASASLTARYLVVRQNGSSLPPERSASASYIADLGRF